jgi:hypothetical protein
MNKERKLRNKELRREAPIPEGVENLIGITWKNKYNFSLITIEYSTVTNSGNVFWHCDTGGVYSTHSLNDNWDRIDEEE